MTRIRRVAFRRARLGDGARDRARARRRVPHARVRLRPAPSRRARGRAARVERARRRCASRDSSVARRLRRLGANRSEHRRARARRCRHSGHVRSRAQHRVLEPGVWRWPRSSLPTRSSSASIAVDYSGYPDCRPEYIAAFQALARARDETRRRRRRAVVIDAPLITMSKADIIRRGLELDVDYSLTVSCYQADDARPRLRPLRLVPAAPGGFRRRRCRRSDALRLSDQASTGRKPGPAGRVRSSYNAGPRRSRGALSQSTGR